MTQTRQTIYKTAVMEYLQAVGHATNTEILAHLRTTAPSLSATTVHRVTSGLVAQNAISVAPPSPDNSTRFDANTVGHDHFECKICGCLRDINLPAVLLQQLEASLAGCKFSGHLNIQGTCQKCLGTKG